MITQSRDRLSGGLFGLVLSVCFASMGSLASAATLQADNYARSEFGAARNAMNDFLTGNRIRGLETFEGHPAWNGASGTSNPRNTNVGSFTTLGGHGTGGAAVNGGRSLEVRGDNTMPWGRYNTDTTSNSLGGNWLDTNDTYGMKWEVAGLGRFDTLAFFLTDVADVGATFSIKVGDELFSDIAGSTGRIANGSIHLIRIALDRAVENLTVELIHDRLNDGFGIDGATVVEVAPVPVPPAAALLVTGLAAFAGLRRRRPLAASEGR
jgi:MYXO-CTERM domain-containing protein